MEEVRKDRNKPGRGNRNRLLLLILQGAIIGVGGILPGISGGVLCVIFGLYKPVIEVLSNPLTNLKYHWKLIIPVAIGVGLGFLGSAGAVSVFMERNAKAAVCVFIGLIIGMIPGLWKDAGQQGRTSASVPSMIGSFADPFSELQDHFFSGFFGLPSQKALHGEKKCPVCNASYHEIASSGKVGCAQCYDTFAEELSRSIQSIHGTTSHTGAIPSRQRAKQERTQVIARLKKELQDAISREDYESAARLRDEIRGMEQNEEKEDKQ
jgi:hypothetical protein